MALVAGTKTKKQPQIHPEGQADQPRRLRTEQSFVDACIGGFAGGEYTLRHET